jgi:hypothetical protein
MALEIAKVLSVEASPNALYGALVMVMMLLVLMLMAHGTIAEEVQVIASRMTALVTTVTTCRN